MDVAIKAFILPVLVIKIKNSNKKNVVSAKQDNL